MRAPQQEDEFSSFEIVRFALSADEQALERARDREGWAGHPPWLRWFCDEHLALGEKLVHLHWREAMERLRTSQR